MIYARWQCGLMSNYFHHLLLHLAYSIFHSTAIVTRACHCFTLVFIVSVQLWLQNLGFPQVVRSPEKCRSSEIGYWSGKSPEFWSAWSQKVNLAVTLVADALIIIIIIEIVHKVHR